MRACVGCGKDSVVTLGGKPSCWDCFLTWKEGVGGGLAHLNRSNTVELSRLCAPRKGLCRLGIRLWREFVFPRLGKNFAISYADSDLHSGATYRFDGWGRSPRKSHSGTDRRSGRQGRNKWVWVWPAHGAAEVSA